MYQSFRQARSTNRNAHIHQECIHTSKMWCPTPLTNWLILFEKLFWWCNSKQETVWKVILKQWHIISDKLGCEQTPFIGFRMTQSLRNILIKSDAITSQKRNVSVKRHDICAMCKPGKLSLSLPSISFEGKKTYWLYELHHQ